MARGGSVCLVYLTTEMGTPIVVNMNHVATFCPRTGFPEKPDTNIWISGEDEPLVVKETFKDVVSLASQVSWIPFLYRKKGAGE